MECENARLNERDFLGGLKKGIVFAFAVLKKGLGFKELRGTLQEPINQERWLMQILHCIVVFNLSNTCRAGNGRVKLKMKVETKLQ